MGIFALRSATMDSRVPLHASRCGLICSQKTRRVRGPAAAALRTVFSERGVGESSLRGAAVLAASVAQPRGRDVPFELAGRSELWASRSDLGSRTQPRGQVRLDWDTRKVRATCSVVRLRWGCRADMIFCEMSPLTTELT